MCACVHVRACVRVYGSDRIRAAPSVHERGGAGCDGDVRDQAGLGQAGLVVSETGWVKL